VVFVHCTAIEAFAVIAEVKSEAVPKLRLPADTLQFGETVAVQVDEPAFAMLPGFDEQFGLIRR
jgi:hypothetical protein